MLLSTFYFSIMNVFIKMVGHIPEMEIVFFRCLVAMILSGAMVYRQGISWQGNNRLLLLARGMFGTLALYTFFITLHEMPLGTAVTIQYLSPIFTTVIALYFLNEQVKWIQWVFFLLSFTGVLVIKGFDNSFSLSILLVGILSAASSGVAYNLVRRLREAEHPAVVVLHFQLVGVAAGGIACLFNWQVPSLLDLICLIMVGVMTHLGQINLTQALQLEKVANVSIFNYLGVLYALAFGFLFFNETPPLLSLSGILLVLAGVVFNYLYTRRKAKYAPETDLPGSEE